ncbi:MAG: FG-GAP repeat protein [Candidatus Pacebacteria bacterium]|nr:FG-GAP repeat protein [Candidatus Paceibacterota bacterium]
MSGTKRRFFGVVGIVLVAVLVWVWWGSSIFQTNYPTITDDLAKFPEIKDAVTTDFQSYPLLALNDEYTLTDTLKDGVEITYGNTGEDTPAAQGSTLNPAEPSRSNLEGGTPSTTTFTSPDLQESLSLQFPQTLSEPLAVTLPGGRTFTVTHQVEGEYTSELLTNPPVEVQPRQNIEVEPRLDAEPQEPQTTPAPTYLKYQSPDSRLTTYYAYQKDQAAGYRNLKHWTIFKDGTGHETQSYTFRNAHLKTNDRGEVEVRYIAPMDETKKAEVGDDLWARAQAVLSEDLAASIDERAPDLLIPPPYTIDANGNKVTHEWQVMKVSEYNPADTSNDYLLSVSFEVPLLGYPIALDPTLQFTAPGTTNAGDYITGETASNYFGFSLTTGDFNADGKDDLVIGAYGYNSNQGRVYIFYGGDIGTIGAAKADITLTGGAASDAFGSSLTTGDFNADGEDDLAVGAKGYNSNQGRTYLFYGGYISSKNASDADVIYTGGATGDYFGNALTVGDFNGDGKEDLAVGAHDYLSSQGRVYIFYGSSMISEGTVDADITITGNSIGDYFGFKLATGDFNADGNDDLTVGAHRYNSYQGRAYIFYGGSIVTEGASGADITLTGTAGANNFSHSLAVGDFNVDGKADLAVGAHGYNSSQGQAYIFYGGSMISEGTAGADVTFTGEVTLDSFGYSLTADDFNSDGKDDLAAGAYYYSSGKGRAYLFYGGSMSSKNASVADVVFTGETSSRLGSFLSAGDLNVDGKIDLVASAAWYNTSQGRAYIFYSQSGQVNLDKHITGEGTSDYFGSAFTTGDFNADGRPDLAVGAYTDNTNTGKVYIFYNDGSYPTGAASADVILTGGATNNFFGVAMITGDFNADGKDDIAVGAYGYNSHQGRAYIFYGGSMISEGVAGADITLTGETTLNDFGYILAAADFNADGKDDLVVGAYWYNSYQGRVYVFYGGSMISEGTAGADVTLTGEASDDQFGISLTTGDFNVDGKDDLVVGAYGYNFAQGRAYLFYGGNIITENASGSDVTLTGEIDDAFGAPLTTGDLNHDGKDDLIVSAIDYNSSQGRSYIFYGGSMTSESASGADVTLTGETTDDIFGYSHTAGDFNHDGKDDLVVGARGYYYGNSKGRAYIFYGGSFITENATGADVILTGNTDWDMFSYALATFDYNADGRDDLVVGAPGYGDTGRLYFYETRENYAWEIQRQSLVDGLRVDPLMGYEMKITGETTSNSFGTSIALGDLNADGKDDLIVGASGYNSNQGRVYIFYNDGNYPTKAGRADVTLTGEATSNSFGVSLTTGDWNADGKDDLAVGASGYNSSQGRAYIFYGGAMINEGASGADITLAGETTSNYFGSALTTGDFNTDGKDDLVVGAYLYNTIQGRAYIFYSGSMASESATGADVTLTGETTLNYFGYSLTTGDFNHDGTNDLAVGARGYSSNQGRAYVFYGGSMVSENATGADVTLTGETTTNRFSYSLTTGDLNADGKDDLAIGATWYNSSQGRAYIFYGGSMISENATGADVTLTGETTSNYFGSALTTGDFNTDGKDDLAVGAYGYTTNTGRSYIFYGGSIITENASGADVILTGEGTNNSYGSSLTTGDLNADGKDDLLVGATGYNSSQGRLYFYTTNDFQLTGGANLNYFGASVAVGDFNADGNNDLSVGAYGYNSNQGRVYIFYGGAYKTETVSGADVTLTGGATSDYFGSLTVGDFNADGKDDIAVGAFGYNGGIFSGQGRVYIFYGGAMISEGTAGADITITGETTSNAFGSSLSTGNLNADGKDDLVVGARNYSSGTGRAYIFYGGSIITENASGADVTLTGESSSNNFGSYVAKGSDLNADGKDDLVVSAVGYNSSQGRVYIFYGGAMSSENASGADITLTGEATGEQFGYYHVVGDWDNDNKNDLAVSANAYNTTQGRVYIFYGDNLATKNASAADMILTGETTSNHFGVSLASGDLNADGKDDLAAGASLYGTSRGRVYVFYGKNLRTTSVTHADVIINGQKTGIKFGEVLALGDLSGNGVNDLIVGASAYDNATADEGRVYVLMSEAATVKYSQFRQTGTMKIKGHVEFR